MRTGEQRKKLFQQAGHKASVYVAIGLAELVLPKWTAMCPNDKRPAEAIAAAKRWLECPTDENCKKAFAAAYACAAACAADYAANAANAAYAASCAAAAAAAACAADSAANAANAATDGSAELKNVDDHIDRLLVEYVGKTNVTTDIRTWVEL